MRRHTVGWLLWFLAVLLLLAFLRLVGSEPAKGRASKQEKAITEYQGRGSTNSFIAPDSTISKKSSPSPALASTTSFQ